MNIRLSFLNTSLLRGWCPSATVTATVAVIVGALAGLSLPLHAQSQAASNAYPNKTVRFVNNFPPGGPSDVLARSMADALQTSLKQTFIVENKAGAGGNVGADLVAKSPADGYTVLFGIDTAFTVNPHIYKTMPFKPSDLKPVMVMACPLATTALSTCRSPVPTPTVPCSPHRVPVVEAFAHSR